MRSMIKTLPLAGLAALAIASSAAGADLRTMPTKAPPPPPPAFSWTGCYIGGNAGGIWERDTATMTFSEPVNIGIARAVTAGAIPTSFSYDRGSWLAGGQLGCNYQVTNWVLGVETDIDATHLNGGQSISTSGIGGFFPLTSAVNQEMTWIGTTRGRFGVIMGSNVMLYGTAGVAYGNVKYSYLLNNTPAGPIATLATDSATQVGWTAGGGVEVGFDRWSVKGEALWYDLGSHTLTAPCTLVGGGVCSTPNAAFFTKFENHGIIARVGLNYRFLP